MNYLSHETEAFGDDLSSRITEQSRDVAGLGDEIQSATDAQSQLVENIGREVDSDDSMSFPSLRVDQDFPSFPDASEGEEEENGGK